MSWVRNTKEKIYKILSISNLGNSFVVTLGTSITLALFSLLTGMLLARWLGPSGRGELAAIQAWPSFLAVIAVIGIPEALVYYSARQPNDAGKLLTTSISVALLACIPFLLLGFFIIPFFLNAQSIEVINSSRKYLYLLPLMAIVGMIPHPLRGRGNISTWNLVRSLPIIAWLFVILLLEYLGRLTPENVTRGYLIGLAIIILPSIMIFMKRVPGPYNPSGSYIKPMVVYGLPAVLSIIPSTLNIRLDQMMMPAILEPGFLGYYAVAVAWSSALIPFIGVIPAILLPNVASRFDKEDQRMMLAQITRISVPIILIFTSIVTILSPFAIRVLFGAEYKPAIFPAVLLSIAGGVMGFNQLLHSGAMSLGHPKLVLYSESLGLIVTVVLLFLLLPKLNIVGAAIASLLSYSITFVFMFYLIRNQTGLSYKALVVLNHQDIVLLNQKWVAIKSILTTA